MAPALRPSGYISPIYERLFGSAGPWYDLVVGWGLFPLGGDRRCRRLFAEWCEVGPGQRVVSLACGTGNTERAILEATPTAELTAIDLGAGQIARARRKWGRAGLAQAAEFRVGDASDTGLQAASFDRVLVGLCLHEMPAELRRRVLAEAVRLCAPDGRVIAIEHNRASGRWARRAQWLWWLYWLPGNPEARTSLDLQRSGLDREMEQAGLRVVARHATRPDWVQGVVACPAG